MNDIKIPSTVILAVNAYLVARTFALTQRDTVDTIKSRILAESVYQSARVFSEGKPQRITDPGRAWQMSDDDFADFLSAVRDDLTAEGYYVHTLPGEPYHSFGCPALNAEAVQRSAEHLIIDAAADMLDDFGDFRSRLKGDSIDTYHEFIDLIVGMVVTMPGYERPEIIKGGNK